MAGSVLRRLADGDPAAMQECIDEYRGLVWSLARRLCHDPAEAEDATQEVFIALWESAGRFDETKGAEATFVAMIARRRLIDSGRRRHRRRRLDEEAKSARRPEAEGFEQRILRADETRRAAEAIGMLSEGQQKVLELAIHRGLTHDEIAHTTGLPLGTVKTHARRGLIRIRELLAEEQQDEPPRSRR